ncbi:unnamed protein product [Adineta steineri]|uniref:Tetraspanin n=1 Tax=Adineta steineri TaxID=433720 RepID=A0A814CG34_9BILA|nr:unnamed protein product [Adineta steineri]
MGHGGMNCQLKTVRLILIIINVIFFLIGATLFGEGIDLLITRRFHSFTEFLSNIENGKITKNVIFSNEILYIFKIIPGFIFIFTGFFGCSGAITQMQSLLFCYFSFVGIILIFQTIIILSLIAFRIYTKQQLISIVQLFIRDKYKGPLEKTFQLKSFLLDSMMYHFKCCGIGSKHDFNVTYSWNRTNPWWNTSMLIENRDFKYPLTCCPMNNTLNDILSCAMNGTYIHELSCYEKITDIFYSMKEIILFGIVFIIIIEMLALIFVLIIHNRNQTMMLYIFLFNLIISGLWCQDIERVIVEQGQPFSFDCQLDDLVYFGRKINEWSEIQENNENYLYLNINFNYITKDNILRVKSDSAQSKHIGFYACRKPTWISTSMNSIYQLILADVQSFYWNHICYAPTGSCQRVDDVYDENLSKFEVIDQTNVELFCCASVTGYKNVNVYMNPIGDIRGNVEINRKQEIDGSWVVCANQRTILKRTPYLNQQTLTCELLIDDRRHSILSSVIIIKDPIRTDSTFEHSFSKEGNQNDGYFNKYTSSIGRSRRRMTTGKKIAIIIGSILAGLFLLGLIIFVIVFIYRNKKIQKHYSSVRTSEPPRYLNERNINGEEPIYEEPTQLSVKTPVFMRC